MKFQELLVHSPERIDQIQRYISEVCLTSDATTRHRIALQDRRGADRRSGPRQATAPRWGSTPCPATLPTRRLRGQGAHQKPTSAASYRYLLGAISLPHCPDRLVGSVGKEPIKSLRVRQVTAPCWGPSPCPAVLTTLLPCHPVVLLRARSPSGSCRGCRRGCKRGKLPLPAEGAAEVACVASYHSPLGAIFLLCRLATLPFQRPAAGKEPIRNLQRRLRRPRRLWGKHSWPVYSHHTTWPSCRRSEDRSSVLAFWS
ncbi:hypothetical protein NDU88_004523 [Pleurodeles waltl]|uniref:Uncharacterized protein n=1 Tax=Pleurodeles waltl TaxID=8319 RepID=A0AAV7VKN0_PLEWA|nr:hypothetical protein NDU88_004523 [Pleurodeles waltl]